MNQTIGTFFIAAGTLLATALTAQTTPAKAPQSAATPPAKTKAKVRKKKGPTVLPIAIPVGAVKTKEGAYRYVDPRGRAWLYKETPFGVSRVPESPGVSSGTVSTQTPFGVSTSRPVMAPEVPASDTTAHVSAVLNGEQVEFSRPTPFGVTSWKKNRSNLTANEQKILDREQAKRNQ